MSLNFEALGAEFAKRCKALIDPLSARLKAVEDWLAGNKAQLMTFEEFEKRIKALAPPMLEIASEKPEPLEVKFSPEFEARLAEFDGFRAAIEEARNGSATKDEVAALIKRLEALETEAPPTSTAPPEPVEIKLSPEDLAGITERVEKALGPLLDKISGELTESLSSEVEPEVMRQWVALERRIMDKATEAIANIPRPKDALEALELEYDDQRTLTFTLFGQTKVLKFPAMIYREVFKGDARYEKHDCVTWSGSLFIAMADEPKGVPGASKDWRLMVKKGRDAK